MAGTRNRDLHDSKTFRASKVVTCKHNAEQTKWPGMHTLSHIGENAPDIQAAINITLWNSEYRLAGSAVLQGRKAAVGCGVILEPVNIERGSA